MKVGGRLNDFTNTEKEAARVAYIKVCEETRISGIKGATSNRAAKGE